MFKTCNHGIIINNISNIIIILAEHIALLFDINNNNDVRQHSHSNTMLYNAPNQHPEVSH